MVSLRHRLLAGLLPLLWLSMMTLSQAQEPPIRQEHEDKRQEQLRLKQGSRLQAAQEAAERPVLQPL